MHLPSGTPGADDDAPAFDPRSLTAAIPTRMRAGRPVTVDVRVPRRHLEALSGGADAVSRAQHVITKAMAMRLKGQPGEFTIENASPETQWSEGFGGPLSDDIVSWRWIVTPRRSGRLNLQVSGTTRIVGRDGLAAERPLPAQRVTIRVTPDYGAITRRAAVLLLIGLGAGALGYYGEGLFDMGRAMLAQVTR
jgi:hypothetical protein